MRSRMREGNGLRWPDVCGYLFDEEKTAYQTGVNGPEGFYPLDVELNVRCDLEELKRRGGHASKLDKAALRYQYEKINRAYMRGCAERARRIAA